MPLDSDREGVSIEFNRLDNPVGRPRNHAKAAAQPTNRLVVVTAGLNRGA